MKNLISLCVVVLVITLSIPVVAGEKGAAKAPAKSAASEEAPAFAQAKSFGKLKASLQKAYLAAIEAGDPGRTFKCFVRVEPPYDQGDQSFLFSKGFNVITNAGNIVRGSVKAKDLQAVAELPFVQKISLAN